MKNRLYIGWGASGRNGGFGCRGGIGIELQQFAKVKGVEGLKHYFRAQIDAVNLLLDIADVEHLDIQAQGSAELTVAHSAKAFEKITAEHEFICSQLGMESRLVTAVEFKERYYDSTEQFGAARMIAAQHAATRHCRLSVARQARLVRNYKQTRSR